MPVIAVTVAPRHRAVEQPGAAHLLEEHVDVERTLANDVLLQGVNHLRAAFAAVDALAVADQPVVCGDADEG